MVLLEKRGTRLILLDSSSLTRASVEASLQYHKSTLFEELQQSQSSHSLARFATVAWTELSWAPDTHAACVTELSDWSKNHVRNCCRYTGNLIFLLSCALDSIEICASICTGNECKCKAFTHCHRKMCIFSVQRHPNSHEWKKKLQWYWWNIEMEFVRANWNDYYKDGDI